jgi:toxin YoeB
MAVKVVWTARAQKDRFEIFSYWNARNKSNTYSRKLNTLFIASVKIISQYPLLGKPTSEKDVRFKIVKDYLIFYEYSENIVIILMIWDSRQNPDRIKTNY